MHVNIHALQGVIVKDNEVYCLEDNNTLEHLTLSKTTLKPGQQTRGHSHEDQEEVYFFTQGEAEMILGDESIRVYEGSIVLIPRGKFHKVINMSNELTCAFVCVFEKYDRQSNDAKYE